jgi:uncharacterized protein (TIGR02145 family)
MNKLFPIALCILWAASCNPYKRDLNLPDPAYINEQLNDLSNYPTVNINGQIWMTQNWAGNRFRNGDTLFYAGTLQDWIYASDHQIPAWTYGDFGEPIMEEFFNNRYYNWHAVKDPRGLAPEGWRVPGLDDWDELLKHYNINQDKTQELKSSSHWSTDETGNNASGFNATPHGLCGDMTGFMNERMGAYWWSSDSFNTEEAWYINISYDHYISKHEWEIGGGLNVRLIKN